jgi:ABC-2 type transport system permease protein
MTIVTPLLPRTARERLRWAASDAWIVARRDLAHWVRQPAPIIVGLLFPILMVLMFGYLLGGGMALPGGADYREFLLPGMFAMTMLFGIEATMTAVTTDAARGVTDRFRSMPMAPSAVVAGRSIADMLNSLLGLVIMLVCGLLVGWQWRNGIASALLAVGLLLLLRFAVLWFGIYLGLVARSPQAVVSVQILIWPFLFLSNVFVAPETMPSWLGAIAQWNPLSATVSACRELFGNPGWAAVSWVDHNAVLMAVAWPVALLAIFFPLAVRRYQRLQR